jgi:hypothetical protein
LQHATHAGLIDDAAHAHAAAPISIPMTPLGARLGVAAGLHAVATRRSSTVTGSSVGAGDVVAIVESLTRRAEDEVDAS